MKTYLLLISFFCFGSSGTLFSQPANDKPCAAILVDPGDCVSGTTIGADADFTFPGCPDSYLERAVFYKYNLGADSRKLIVDLGPNNLTPQMAIGLLVFPDGCSGTPSLASWNSFYCGVLSDQYEFKNLEPGSTVYLMIATAEPGADFSGLCLADVTGSPSCAENYTCSYGDIINIPHTADAVCVSGCNRNMPPGAIQNCNGALLHATAWYKFNTGPANTAVFDLSSTDLPDAHLVLLKDCNTVLECDPQTAILEPHREYYIGVSDQNGAEGEFELCITLLETVTPCIKDERLEIIGANMGSPLGGPFQPCETVTFRYSTDFYSGVDCQWLHSFIPYLSSCWGSTLPQLAGYPDGTNGANLSWYPAGTVYWKPTIDNPPSALGINSQGQICLIGTPGCMPFTSFDGSCGSTNGTPMPAGWVVTNASGNCNGSTDPNASWGISQGCNTSSVKALTFTMTIPCDACTSCNEDEEGLVVGMASFTDGTTGGWSNPQCNGNVLLKKKLIVDCCRVAQLDLENDTICYSGIINTDFSVSIPNTILKWTVLSADGVEGAASGSGPMFYQKLKNTTGELKEVTYAVRSITPQGCESTERLFSVYALPELRSGLDTLIQVCGASEILLEPHVSGGTGGVYTYAWSNGSAEDHLNYFVSKDTLLTLTVTDMRGCTVTDTVRIRLTGAEAVGFPDDLALYGPALVMTGDTAVYGVDPFPNATNYFWTFDGQYAGDQRPLPVDFSLVGPGEYELCIHAFNCNPDTLRSCYLIRVIDGYSNADCAGADTVCDKSLREFSYQPGFGFLEELGGSAGCDFGITESYSHWLTWEMAKAGQLWFTLYPQSSDDVDFVVFRSAEGCDLKEPVRCSFAKCAGATGLIPGKEDVAEGPECKDEWDNYLKPLDCKAGERYYLLVNSYSGAGGTFGIEFCGDALMSCDDKVCISLADKPPVENRIKIYPNPAGNLVRIEGEYGTACSVNIYDLSGRKVAGPANTLSGDSRISVQHLVPGFFIIEVKDVNGVVILREKLVKI